MKIWNRDIDKMVAEKVDGWIFNVGPGRELAYYPDLGFCSPSDFPHYTSDIVAASQMEDQIDKTPGLFNEYISALTDILQIPKPVLSTSRGPSRGKVEGTGQGFSKGEVWAFIRATPRQRSLAALKCVGVEIQADSELRP